MSLIFPQIRSHLPAELRGAFRALNDMHTALSGPLAQQMRSGPAIDIEEDKEAYHFSADIPGAKKEDLKLSFGEDGQTLTLSGSVARKSQTPENPPEQVSPSSWVSERFQGNFVRTIKLPTTIDTKAVKASYTDGVLRAVIPKLSGGKAQTVKIE